MVAIEPDPTNYRFLLKNILLNNCRNIKALKVAAWCRKTRVRLYRTYISSLHSVIYTKNVKEVIAVEALPLDRIIQELGINRCDYVKIDAEGAEFVILKGMMTILKKMRPKLVVEVSRKLSDILFLLNDAGYHISIVPAGVAIGRAFILFCEPMEFKNSEFSNHD